MSGAHRGRADNLSTDNISGNQSRIVYGAVERNIPVDLSQSAPVNNGVSSAPNPTRDRSTGDNSDDMSVEYVADSPPRANSSSSPSAPNSTDPSPPAPNSTDPSPPAPNSTDPSPPAPNSTNLSPRINAAGENPGEENPGEENPGEESADEGQLRDYVPVAFMDAKYFGLTMPKTEVTFHERFLSMKDALSKIEEIERRIGKCVDPRSILGYRTKYGLIYKKIEKLKMEYERAEAFRKWYEQSEELINLASKINDHFALSKSQAAATERSNERADYFYYNYGSPKKRHKKANPDNAGSNPAIAK